MIVSDLFYFQIKNLTGRLRFKEGQAGCITSKRDRQKNGITAQLFCCFYSVYIVQPQSKNVNLLNIEPQVCEGLLGLNHLRKRGDKKWLTILALDQN